MLTGDAVAIAKETCRQLSLGTNVYDSERLITANMSGSDVSRIYFGFEVKPC
jgi:H+-transporting ATPase